MSTYGITLTILATQLAEALAKDEADEVGFDISAGIFGKHLSDWLRATAKELDRRASPASVPAWTHSCNALCIDGLELWIPQCPHCGKPAPTPPVSEDRWQPIETAPKDGSYVLLAGKRREDIASGYWPQSAYAGNGAWIWPFVHKHPTHWMPLPKAPAMQEDKP